MTAPFGDDASWIERIRATVLAALPASHTNVEIEGFYRLLRAYPERSGKALRGLLVLHSTAAHGGDPGRGLRSAAGIELFQNWVLVHDDIEDASEERRGQPALHRLVGVPVALNVGDAMHVYMWQSLLAHPPETFSQREAILAEFLRTIHRTAEGQHLDLSWVAARRFDIGEDDYLAMVRLKTAYYTVLAPLRLGALCADSEPDSSIDAPALELGVAFQIRDDVLNLQPGSGYGKEFAGDLYEGKRTLILAHLFAHASSADRDEATTLLAKPRHDKRHEEVARLLELIERYGSIGYAQLTADTCAAAGLAGLRAWGEGLPGTAAALRMLELLDTVAKRSR